MVNELLGDRELIFNDNLHIQIIPFPITTVWGIHCSYHREDGETQCQRNQLFVQGHTASRCWTMFVVVIVYSLSRIWLFVTPWTVACQAPLSMAFPRQEYWCGLPFPPPGHLPDPGIEPVSPALAGRFFPTKSPGKPSDTHILPWKGVWWLKKKKDSSNSPQTSLCDSGTLYFNKYSLPGHPSSVQDVLQIT